MNEKVYASLKSADTEDWVDYHIVRPFTYYWACFFAKLGIHPNTVTIASMFIGAGSAWFFAHGSYFYEGRMGIIYNLIAFLLLFIADILDNTDGQLARMTGKKSPLGRILDGAAGFTWYLPIYIALVYRFYIHHDFEFGWLGIENTQQNALVATVIVFLLALVAGIWGLARPQRIADYYIQTHLFFLKGEKGSELDSSVVEKEKYDKMSWKDNFIEKLFQKNYVSYTQNQEGLTPQFQNLLALLRKTYGSTEHFPVSVREEFTRQSKSLMKYVFMLVFNFRTSYLILFCLLDLPAEMFVFEIIIMLFLSWFVIHQHEAFCKKIAQSIK
ncbi:MAG: CDP-alcohol phosphatidyltransferase family protein [Bacteroidaceae bacterium]|nr:CDP-alcohol phosphatidyltransferase family protein [Bacteroidaceae bacterium]